jgi:hypothetical protein
MVTVAVSAVALITEQQIGVFGAQYVGQPLRRLVAIRSPESDPSRRIRIELRSEAAVGVTEAFDSAHSENRGAAAELGQPNAVVLVVHPPVGCRHDDDTVPGCRRKRQRSAGQDHLIVRMRVERDDGGHAKQYAYRRKTTGQFTDAEKPALV